MDIDIDQVFLDMHEKVKDMNPINAKMKFIIDQYVFLIDGTGNGNVISQDDSEANCTVKTDMDTFKKIKSGKLDSITALLTGKIDIDGNMGLAFRLRHLIDC